MQAKKIAAERLPAEPFHSSRIDRNVLFTMILGLLTAASVILLIFQVNRSLELRIESAEVWSDYQVKIVKSGRSVVQGQFAYPDPHGSAVIHLSLVGDSLQSLGTEGEPLVMPPTRRPTR